MQTKILCYELTTKTNAIVPSDSGRRGNTAGAAVGVGVRWAVVVVVVVVGYYRLQMVLDNKYTCISCGLNEES